MEVSEIHSAKQGLNSRNQKEDKHLTSEPRPVDAAVV